MASTRSCVGPRGSLLSWLLSGSLGLGCTTSRSTPETESGAPEPEPRLAESSSRPPTEPATPDVVHLPRRVAGSSDVVELVVGNGRTCVRQSTGQVQCWGRVDLAGTPAEPRSSPRSMPWLRGAHLFHDAMTDDVGVVSGGCLLELPSRDGDCMPWTELVLEDPVRSLEVERADLDGGDELLCVRVDARPPVCTVMGGHPRRPVGDPVLRTDLVDLELCLERACSVDSKGAVSCGPVDREVRLEGATIELPGPAVQLECSSVDTCARLHDGTVYCWSEPKTVPTLLYSERPQRIALERPALGLSMALLSACSWSRDGRVECWGEAPPSLPPGARARGSLLSPRTVEGLADAVRVAAGSDHCCALHGSGEVSCWGSNRHGQIGDTPAR